LADHSNDSYVQKTLGLAGDKSLFEKSPEQILSLRKSLFRELQTIGLAATRERFEALASLLYHSKAYRIVPLKEMHLRSPVEPFDGRHVARDFVDMIYIRLETVGPGAS